MFPPLCSMLNTELACATFSFPVISGMTALTAGLKKAPQKPRTTPTAKTIHTCSRPTNAATATGTTATPRTASMRIMSPRRSLRSTTTPATGDARIRGSTEAAIRVPINAVDPVTWSTQKPRAIA